MTLYLIDIVGDVGDGVFVVPITFRIVLTFEVERGFVRQRAPIREGKPDSHDKSDDPQTKPPTESHRRGLRPWPATKSCDKTEAKTNSNQKQELVLCNFLDNFLHIISFIFDFEKLFNSVQKAIFNVLF